MATSYSYKNQEAANVGDSLFITWSERFRHEFYSSRKELEELVTSSFRKPKRIFGKIR